MIAYGCPCHLIARWPVPAAFSAAVPVALFARVVGVTSNGKRQQHDNETLSKSDLAQFTGSEDCVSARDRTGTSLTPTARSTLPCMVGVLALDRIAIISRTTRPLAAEEFKSGSSPYVPTTATLTCDDGNGNIVFTKQIGTRMLALDELTLLLCQQHIHVAERVLTSR